MKLQILQVKENQTLVIPAQVQPDVCFCKWSIGTHPPSLIYGVSKAAFALEPQIWAAAKVCMAHEPKIVFLCPLKKMFSDPYLEQSVQKEGAGKYPRKIRVLM